MKIVLLLTIIYLTFMLTINLKLFKLFTRLNNKFITTLQSYNLHIWFGIILLTGLIGLDTFYLTVPKQRLSFTFIFIIFLAMFPFWISSGYKPEKNVKGLFTFCLIFPIGEEILFRGIILYIATHLIGSSIVYVPIPILKGVTLQVFISAICFGITHFQYFGFKFNTATIKKVLFAFVFGLFGGNLVEITGSIIYTVIFHIMANSGATLYYFRKNNKTTETV